MASRPRRGETPPKATFIFKGTVEKLKASALKQVRADAHTIVVRVDEVLESTHDLENHAGETVTVQLGARDRVAAGGQFVFHTVPSVFGETLAVKSLGVEAVARGHARAMARGDTPAVRRHSRALEERVASADVVVSGQVSSVQVPEEAAAPARAGRARAAAMPTTRRPVSEHDPKWRDAIVEVHDVHKGGSAGRRVKVRFPASTDVRWYKAPKFEAGQRGFFLLHRAEGTPGGAAPARATRAVGRARAAGPPPRAAAAVYTALHPADFQPYTQANLVNALTKGRND